jgi:hypothetical protein
LIIYQLLDNEADSWFEVFRFFSLITEFIYYLCVVILERALENLIDVRLGIVTITLQFGVKTFFNDVTRKFKLTESDEILGNLLKYLLILIPVFKLNHVLNKVVAVWILNQLTNVNNDVVGELEFLPFRPFLEASLHDTASVLVLSNWNTVVNASLEDEVSVLTCLQTSDIIVILWSLGCFENHQQ